jgi:hypothetical protein
MAESPDIRTSWGYPELIPRGRMWETAYAQLLLVEPSPRDVQSELELWHGFLRDTLDLNARRKPG